MILLEIMFELGMVFLIWLLIFGMWSKLEDYIDDTHVSTCISSLVCAILMVLTIINHIELVNVYNTQSVELEEAHEKIAILEEEIDSMYRIKDEDMMFKTSSHPEEFVVYQSLDESFDIMYKSNLDVDDLRAILRPYPELLEYSETFYEAERKYGVNALYLVSTIALESGWGVHRSGENNVAGWMNNRGGFMDFDSVEDCIMHVANRLSTTYKEAVGTNIIAVTSRYCPTPGYYEKIIGIMGDLQGELQNESY